jgi:hypothetical protein
VKYDLKTLNILDVEKKALILSNPVELEKRIFSNFAFFPSSSLQFLSTFGDSKRQ